MRMNVSVKSGRKEVYQPLLISIGSLLGFLSIWLIKPVTNFIISCIELVNAIADLLEALVKLRNIWHEFSSKRKNRR
ncbi:hypothetical protein I6E16_00490 [Ligilactobacillus salivarius]|uniref:Uncharacterized protein n=2 Tax=Ligilactobacillus salivarius TaxID=1624 RepID=A0A1V9QTG8_9LACO|nr:hypothetical protein [Ligilactobacillus salivarius]MCF2622636.1 hypothetical protein [Ligilactobacillus salivarius]OQQ82033.1 hypothetical protein B6U60_09270 [Ligilactobacillus salivarius]OQQ84135.1 hypothetical protein B6U59_09420 [Ligilactobacillus salivarius]OYP90519.1 hypothetical protein B9G67_09950 [Ligilactobacillus salivarius]